MSREDPGKILFAAAIGFAAGILFAPRSGQETREQLRKQAEDAKLKASDVAQDVKHKAEVGKEKATTVASKVRRHGKDAKQDVEDEVRSTDELNGL